MGIYFLCSCLVHVAASAATYHAFRGVLPGLIVCALETSTIMLSRLKLIGWEYNIKTDLPEVGSRGNGLIWLRTGTGSGLL